MRSSDFHMIFDHDSDFWGDHSEFPLSDWQAEVANGETRLGYWDWVLDRGIETYEHPNTTPDMTEEEVGQVVLDTAAQIKIGIKNRE